MPVVGRVVDERRLGKYTFKSHLVRKKPDEAAARSDHRILIKGAAQSDDPEDFIFLQRKADKNFPRYVESIASDVVLIISARVQLQARSGVVVHNVFECEMAMEGLKMVGKPVIRAVEIEPLASESSA